MGKKWYANMYIFRLVLVVCNIVCGNFVIKKFIKKPAEIRRNLSSGSWTRTNDIRINSKFLISGLFLRYVVLAQIPATFCTYLCMRRIAVF